jgi:hypothetical protein
MGKRKRDICLRKHATCLDVNTQQLYAIRQTWLFYETLHKLTYVQYKAFLSYFTGSFLSVVATMSEDSDHIDVGECRRRGIEVVTLPKISKDSVANLTLALLIQTLGGKDPNAHLAKGWIASKHDIHTLIYSWTWIWPSVNVSLTSTYTMHCSIMCCN